jgi:hypothetical protein
VCNLNVQLVRVKLADLPKGRTAVAENRGFDLRKLRLFYRMNELDGIPYFPLPLVVCTYKDELQSYILSAFTAL